MRAHDSSSPTCDGGVQPSPGRVAGPDLAQGPARDPGRDLIRVGAALFVVGLGAIVVTFVDYAVGDGNRPLWQNLLCVLAPIGFGLAVLGLVRSGRASARAAALRIGQPIDRPARPALLTGRWETSFRFVAAAEATSWLLLILATIVKYAQGNEVAVHVLGPVHGTFFIVYVALALLIARRRRWRPLTTAVVLAESVLPGGGLLVYRRCDLRR